MGFLYELVILGAPTEEQINDLEKLISQILLPFGLTLGKEVNWLVCPEIFTPDQRRSTAAVFFGGEDVKELKLTNLLRKSIPILPVVSDLSKVSEEIPSEIRHLNCLSINQGGTQRIATALLECAGLLPRQRRIFLSYKRDESRQAALQLFDACSSRRFEVFLDTHGIGPAEDFQANLWHQLCDSDVLVMLDTPNYFVSRWTSAEYGRALSKDISVLQVVWPGVTPSDRTATASRIWLIGDDCDKVTGKLSEEAVSRICSQLEMVRSKSHAVRNLIMVSNLRIAIEKIGGSITGVGESKAVYVRLADGSELVVYPTVGVPTSVTLHDASVNTPDRLVAVIYDHVGLNPSWVAHLDWLGGYISSARWVKAADAAWLFADWEVKP